jgi:hypothetical protein
VALARPAARCARRSPCGDAAANYAVKLAVDRERPAAADAMIRLPTSSSPVQPRCDVHGRRDRAQPGLSQLAPVGRDGWGDVLVTAVVGAHHAATWRPVWRWALRRGIAVAVS